MDNLIYQIKMNNKYLGVGFFCEIEHKNKKIQLLITSYQTLNEKNIGSRNNIIVSLNNNDIVIKVGFMMLISEKYNLSVIEIKNETNDINFIEIDENIYKNKTEELFTKKTIYIIHCQNKKKEFDKFVTYGIIDNANNSKLKLLCNSNYNLIASPISNLENNKLIGICKNKTNCQNEGFFLKFIIDELIKEYKYKKNELKYNNHNLSNEIDISINIEKEDIGKKIYFLKDEFIDEQGEKYINKEINQLNEINTKILINNKSVEFNKFFEPEKEGKYNINIKYDLNLTDCSYMFAGCENITAINFIFLNTKNVTSMKDMFYNCINLEKICNLFTFDTKKVTDMSYMFYRCYKLSKLDLFSFSTHKVINMSHMFHFCTKLNYLDLSSFDIKEETNIDYIFSHCLDLNYIISPHDNNEKSENLNNLLISSKELELTSMKIDDMENEICILINVEKKDINKDIYFLDKLYFNNNLLDLKDYNTELYINKKKVRYKKFFKPEKEGVYLINILFNIDLINCKYMFTNCENIIKIKFISFNTRYVEYMENMFDGCINLTNIYNLFLFDTQMVKNMSYMFNKCHKLNNINLSSFNNYYVTDMKYMFNECTNLINLDFPSSFGTQYVEDMSSMFYGCSSLTSLNISSFKTERVKDMNMMFNNCKSLINLDLSTFNTINVNKMNSMFQGCHHLKYLDLSNFNTKNVTNMKCMFNQCTEITSLNLSEFDTQNVVDMSGMFNKCYNLIKIEFPSLFDTKKQKMLQK